MLDWVGNWWQRQRGRVRFPALGLVGYGLLWLLDRAATLLYEQWLETSGTDKELASRGERLMSLLSDFLSNEYVIGAAAATAVWVVVSVVADRNCGKSGNVAKGKKPTPEFIDILRHDRALATRADSEADLLSQALSQDVVIAQMAVDLPAGLEGHAVGLETALREAITEHGDGQLSFERQVAYRARLREHLVMLKGNDIRVFAYEHEKTLPERWSEREPGDEWTWERQLVIAFGPADAESVEVEIDNGQPRRVPYEPQF
ncbi:MAG: hypothetical protein ACMVY4_13465 [Minwuia sp.]|uniref:hypothetical protein n=1 Tax=Minwuia sp. TaxID=2493630 RepID=UPI003A87EB58